MNDNENIIKKHVVLPVSIIFAENSNFTGTYQEILLGYNFQLGFWGQ